MPSTIQTHRYADLCGRIFGIRGVHVGACLDDVFPGLDLNDQDPLLVLLRDERRYCIEGTRAAGGAGTYAFVELVNPYDSGVLMRVDEVHALTTAAGHARAATMDASGASPGSGYPTPLDTRIQRSLALGPSPSVGFVSVGIPAAAPVVGWMTFTEASTMKRTALPRLVLSPGNTLRLTDITANEALSVVFFWTERLALPDEL